MFLKYLPQFYKLILTRVVGEVVVALECDLEAIHCISGGMETLSNNW
ncbi:hypothetical protein TUN199_10917 [Pyrenophora tritici-repentis]|uniref:Uncharacterized protein n=1 Tax=Pyrenophora tritici-repentis TaxID=45151 RepID=A0A5M9KY00_9PLEO|nr:hypothetical protein PtrV1_12702 [Pyrenophora tritici-repentis]KAF7445514.1 hypothetical protein A1F99_105000 [Pyrenophora tritici-repentis]KAF7565796.1 hypothetical protein PtrM4_052300 [Pyrenophora tritici-repentis]KAI0571569.1 hypothetical protein Alg130_10838 [Pyrenophora tritici-repentis]KAI0583575.1 hypothetical protein Alg215_03542 [Pyrenophora tritici-repentis]